MNMDFNPSGEFINPHFDDLLFETIGDNYLRNQVIVIALVYGENFEKYYHLRWEMLRKEMGQKRGTELDEFEEASFHVMAVNLSNNDVVGVGRIHALNENKFQIIAFLNALKDLFFLALLLDKLLNVVFFVICILLFCTSIT